ncbi:MAG: hypothetical protein AAF655_26520 [Bacteroidota bacterium]
MKRFLWFLSVAIFSIFIGSQITEGVLLLPYWQSLSAADFYSYYSKFGTSIGRFYTVLTITAALTPLIISVYCRKIRNSKALVFALVSSLFALLFVASFYIYFKGANELFFQATLSEDALATELITWGYLHW